MPLRVSRPVLTAVVALAVATGSVLAAPGVAFAAVPDAPTAVVVLGDSAAAGDGAGDYEPGTRGEDGNWCHRSRHAYVRHTGLAERAVNLACSGARSTDVAFGAPGRYTEGSQAAALGEVARRLRVTTVVVQVGANDRDSLTDTGRGCIRAFLDPTEPPCRESVGPQLPARTRAMAAGVQAAVGDVRAAMTDAGYTDADYVLVLASYAPPISGDMIGVPAAEGCPYSRPDARWGHDVLFPAHSDALAGVADRVGARFLDLDRATDGFETCTQEDPRREWHRRLTVEPEAFVHGGLDAFGYHLAQESFHPTAVAHERIGWCVGELVRRDVDVAECITDADGETRLRNTARTPPVA